MKAGALAHSQNLLGQYHYLIQHLEEVGKLSYQFASKFNSSQLALFVGYWHDVGKFNPQFQQYILDAEAKQGPDHSSAGALLALLLLYYSNELSYP